MTIPKSLARPLASRVAELAPVAAPATENPPVPANVIAAAEEALARGETHYTDRPGIPEFRAWVAGHLLDRWGRGLSTRAR